MTGSDISVVGCWLSSEGYIARQPRGEPCPWTIRLAATENEHTAETRLIGGRLPVGSTRVLDSLARFLVFVMDHLMRGCDYPGHPAATSRELSPISRVEKPIEDS